MYIYIHISGRSVQLYEHERPLKPSIEAITREFELGNETWNWNFSNSYFVSQKVRIVMKVIKNICIYIFTFLEDRFNFTNTKRRKAFKTTDRTFKNLNLELKLGIEISQISQSDSVRSS